MSSVLTKSSEIFVRRRVCASISDKITLATDAFARAASSLPARGDNFGGRRSVHACGAPFTCDDVCSHAAMRFSPSQRVFFTATCDVHSARRSWTARERILRGDEQVYRSAWSPQQQKAQACATITAFSDSM